VKDQRPRPAPGFASFDEGHRKTGQSPHCRLRAVRRAALLGFDRRIQPFGGWSQTGRQQAGLAPSGRSRRFSPAARHPSASGNAVRRTIVSCEMPPITWSLKPRQGESAAEIRSPRVMSSRMRTSLPFDEAGRAVEESARHRFPQLRRRRRGWCVEFRSTHPASGRRCPPKTKRGGRSPLALHNSSDGLMPSC